MLDEKEKILSDIEVFSYNMKKHALDMALSAKEHAVHFGGGLSIVDILAVLYCKILKIDIDGKNWDNRDRFILSKGHGAIGYYAALVEYGFISESEKILFEQNNSFLMGHPVQNINKGIEFTNGSLGMGLGLGIGTAIACKKKCIDNRVFVLIGDGELNEGSVWEGIMFAPQYKLDNVCLIVDNNHMQLGGYTKDIVENSNLKEKMELFGWNSYEVDGHSICDLYDCFSNIEKNRKPTAIIADTVKGKGFAFSSNNNSWHHSVLTKSQYVLAMEELEKEYENR